MAFNIVQYGAMLAAAGFVLGISRRFLQVRGGKAAPVLLFLLLAAVVNLPIHVGDPFNILLVLPVMLPGFALLCGGSILSRISVGLIIFAMIMSASALITVTMNYLSHILAAAESTWLLERIDPQAVFGVPEIDLAEFDYETTVFLNQHALRAVVAPTLLRMVFWGLVWLVVRGTAKGGPVDLSPRLWRLVDVLALMPVVTVVSLVTLQPIETHDMRLALAILPCAVVCSLGLLYAVAVLARHEALKQQQMLWQVRSQYYENLEQSKTQVSRLRHDMANHLHTMDVLDYAGMRSYLRELLASPAMTGNLRVCDNDIVNAVITSKTASLEEGGIKTEIRADIRGELAVSDIDLCALFANALDNAIEACAKLPRERRFIRLRAASDKGLLMLRLENAAADAPRQEGGRIVTSKRDRASHGFGLASIRDIIEKYDGTMEAEYADGIFVLVCTMFVEKVR